MSLSFSKAVLLTLVYADIFDYPLKLDEIEKWLIKLKVKREKLKVAIKELKDIDSKDGLYFLKGREEIVEIRKRRERYAVSKLGIAKKIASYIRLVPTVKLIGVTGNLAINNADGDDDIDLLIISKKSRLWTTRLLVTLCVELFGHRRHPADINITNKICLNMFMGEDNLVIPLKERDIYSAHEAAQMKVLFDRDLTYQKFLMVNRWVVKYLPNAVDKDMRILRYEDIKRIHKSILNCSIAKLLNCLEVLLKKFQLWYMRKRMTKEVVRDGIIRFHPQDAREWILGEYKLKLQKYFY